MIVTASAWNSLEFVRVLVGFLTPVLLFALGFVVTKAARRVEEAQWASRKLIERRLELHEKMAPKLNDLLCFFRCVGHFRDMSPPDVIRKKRELDQTFFANEQLFDWQFGELYRGFIDSCFQHWSGSGQDAKLRAAPSRIKAARGEDAAWDAAWDSLFSATSGNPAQQAEAYRVLMDAFGGQLGVGGRAGRRAVAPARPRPVRGEP